MLWEGLTALQHHWPGKASAVARSHIDRRPLPQLRWRRPAGNPGESGPVVASCDGKVPMGDKPKKLVIEAGEEWQLALQPSGRFEFRWNWCRQQGPDGLVTVGGDMSTGATLFEVWGAMLWRLTPQDAARFLPVVQAGLDFVPEANERQKALKARLAAAMRAARDARADAVEAEVADLRALLEGGAV